MKGIDMTVNKSKMIKCSKCEKVQPRTMYYKGRKDCKKCFNLRMQEYRKKTNYNREYYLKNKDVENERSLKRYYDLKDNPEQKLKWRENQLKVKYGITLEDYDKMYKSQNYKCAICDTENPNGQGVFHVDHCHNTGKIRGLLCHSCNTALGHLKDCINNLKRAIKYLKKHTKEKK